MDIEQLKIHIVDIVRERQGCKATELVPALVLRVGAEIDAATLIHAIAQLARKGQLLAVEYRLPEMRERTKMFLLPANTRANLSHES